MFLITQHFVNVTPGTGKAPASGGHGFGSSGPGATKDGSMKAPEQDYHISRAGFEKIPAGYFHDLHKE
ncbi:unnamed protein product [Dovyalis caffra]|uniref:Uncharacterized protein n=1 Tax=Dovyalis caffra TaxID=77055 RepID=A0AAV1SPP3_9ROSI|nr:unnamed protein product [Dovyalis caffra]